ncbi:MAG: YraN family protein [Bdellovibrionota bacterium]
MILRNTKDIQLKSINRRLLSLALPQNTVKLLEAFENTSNTKHLHGFLAELQVIRCYLKKGYTLKSHRQKYFKTEIDIVMESSTKIILIEVKLTTHLDFIFYRMSPTQKKRLKNVFLRFIQITSKDVEFHYVITDFKQFHTFEDFLG